MILIKTISKVACFSIMSNTEASYHQKSFVITFLMRFDKGALVSNDTGAV